MKKLLFITTALLTVSNTYSQQLLTEDFNGLTVGDLSNSTVTYAASNAGQNSRTIYDFMATPTNSSFRW